MFNLFNAIVAFSFVSGVVAALNSPFIGWPVDTTYMVVSHAIWFSSFGMMYLADRLGF